VFGLPEEFRSPMAGNSSLTTELTLAKSLLNVLSVRFHQEPHAEFAQGNKYRSLLRISSLFSNSSAVLNNMLLRILSVKIMPPMLDYVAVKNRLK
jgi:hypothetical protein